MADDFSDRNPCPQYQAVQLNRRSNGYGSLAKE